ncbi:MAG: hypothetical protein IJS94_04820, partial [Clostridia bacterium]|nr:hypothetical protein [Clostridia bacterium]
SPVVTETVPTETEMTVPAQRKDTFCFNSYEELACWMGEEENDERDDPAHGEYFSEYIDEIRDGESHIVFPLYNGETAALKSADGEAPIKLMVSEQYNIPWIQYTAEINGRITVIKCACLTGSDKPALKNRFASEVITALEFDTVDMYGSSTAESCFNISDVKMKYDNETVYALLSVYMESGRISLQFACGETLLTMTGSSEALNDSVTKDMSLYDVTLFS